MKLVVGSKLLMSGCMMLVLLSACGNQYRDYQPVQSDSGDSLPTISSNFKTSAPIVNSPATAEQISPTPEEKVEAPAAVPESAPSPAPAPAPTQPEAPKAAQAPALVPAAKPAHIAPSVIAPEPAPFKFEPPVYSPSSAMALLRMPEFRKSWGLSEAIYERVARYYNANRQYFKNPDYVTIVDFSKRSNEKRFFIFDLRKSRVIQLLTTHGLNSDPKNLGFAQDFSNTVNSLQSSLGFFLTLAPYEGSQGYSLRLHGLEASNSKAEERGIVIHSAPYVNEELGKAGRSWGCLALDPKISRSVIDHLQGGSLLYIGK